MPSADIPKPSLPTKRSPRLALLRLASGCRQKDVRAGSHQGSGWVEQAPGTRSSGLEFADRLWEMSKQNLQPCESRPGSRVKSSGLAQTSHLPALSFAPGLRVGRGCAEILASRLPPISSRCCPIAAGRRTVRDSTAVLRHVCPLHLFAKYRTRIGAPFRRCSGFAGTTSSGACTPCGQRLLRRGIFEAAPVSQYSHCEKL